MHPSPPHPPARWTRWLTRFALLVAAVAIGLVAFGQAGGFAGTAPTTLGVQAGRLAPPSLTPNSVSSQAGLYPDHPQRNYAAIAPLRYQGAPDAALQKLVQALQKMERTVLIRQGTDYVYAQSSTRLLRFTDDVEFWLDRTQGVIHVRSASRLGRGDWGVNRQRVEAIRAAFAASAP